MCHNCCMSCPITLILFPPFKQHNWWRRRQRIELHNRGAQKNLLATYVMHMWCSFPCINMSQRAKQHKSLIPKASYRKQIYLKKFRKAQRRWGGRWLRGCLVISIWRIRHHSKPTSNIQSLPIFINHKLFIRIQKENRNPNFEGKIYFFIYQTCL